MGSMGGCWHGSAHGQWHAPVVTLREPSNRCRSRSHGLGLYAQDACNTGDGDHSMEQNGARTVPKNILGASC